jgi:ribosomal protein S27AE
MLCPDCGTLMNCHAEKPVKNPLVPDGEIIASIHYCPACGKVEAEFPPADTDA